MSSECGKTSTDRESNDIEQQKRQYEEEKRFDTQ